MSPLHILLAEDNRGDILLVSKALACHHIEHTLHVVRDGAEAIKFVWRMGKPGEPPCPDIMILDLNLPKADGVEVLSEFRKHPGCAPTPVIVVTSSDAPHDRARVAGMGVSRYFRKPSDLDSFMTLGSIILEVIEECKCA